MRAIADYDAVIIGVSFAGLAATTQLQGAGLVLLADRQPPGAGETSACGTLLAGSSGSTRSTHWSRSTRPS